MHFKKSKNAWLCVRMPRYHRNANETKNSGQIAHEAEMKLSEMKWNEMKHNENGRRTLEMKNWKYEGK